MKVAELFPELVAGLGPELASISVTGLSSDSRKIVPGDVFAALRGAKADGGQFAASAKLNGAIAILADHDAVLAADPGIPVLRAPDARRALALAAARFFPRAPENVVAITGTNGKSSTVDYFRQILATLGFRAASLGTLGAIGPEGVVDLGHTTPDPVAIHATLQRLAEEGVRFAAMEASSHGLDQKRLDGVRLAAVGFTNLTQDHLDYHHDMPTYRAAKLRLFSELAPRGIPAIVNADSPERDAFLAACTEHGLEAATFGWRGADLKITELMPRKAGQRVFVRWRGQDFAFELPLIGEFQALNAICAAAFVLVLNARAPQFEAGAVFAAMEHLKGVRGRLEQVGETAAGVPVFVDYAHTPDGLETLLRAVRPHAAGRVILAFGCGGDRDALKRPKMGAIAARLADLVIVTDDNPRSESPAAIRAAILAQVPGGREIGDRAMAIETALMEARVGDVVLIAGKGHETGQIVQDMILPFSDHETARNFLGSQGGSVT